jgi:hypothetical protein
MLGRLVRDMKDDHRTGAGGNDHAIREAHPLTTELTQELVADSPVCCLVLAPVGPDLSSDFGRQSVR